MAENWLRILGLPLDLQEAVRTLCSHGVDYNKLMTLVSPKRRGRPRKRRKVLAKPALRRGAPVLIPLDMQAIEDVIAEYKMKGSATSDRNAVEILLSEIRDLSGETERAYAERQPTRRLQPLTHKRLVDSIMQRLSKDRARKRLPKSK